MRRHRFMYGKAFDGALPVPFRDASSLEGPAEGLRAVIGQMVSHERSQPAALARGAYLRSLAGLAPLLSRNDNGEGNG